MSEDRALQELLAQALAGGDDQPLRSYLVGHSGLPGSRLNLRLVWDFARAVGEVVVGPDTDGDGDAVAALVDAWAALPPEAAAGDRPDVVLPCAAVAAYGEAAAVRPEWWDHEVAKLRRASRDSRWRVRELVAQAVQRLLAADWDRAMATVIDWASADDPLVVRAAAAGVAEPPLLTSPDRAADALDTQRRAVAQLRSYPDDVRRTEEVRVLRQALGFTVSVAVAALGDFALLKSMAASGDPDLLWAANQNLKKARLQGWPDEVRRVHDLL